MASIESKVISAICENKDIHLILGDDSELFGSHGDAFDFMKDYYLKHKAVPAKSLVQEKFPDIELAKIDAPTAFYVDELRSQFVASRIREIMSKADLALDSSAPGDVLTRLNTSIARLGKYTNSVRDVNLMDGD